MKNYNFLNRYRPQEFTRDWNVESQDGSNQHIAKAGFTLAKAKLGNVQYTFSTYLQDQNYTGYKQSGVLKLNKNGFDILAQGSFLNTTGLTERTTFFRPIVKIEKTFFIFTFCHSSSNSGKRTLGFKFMFSI